MKLKVLALVGLLALAPSAPFGVRAIASHNWRGSQLPDVPDAVAVAFGNAFGRELDCEMNNWSPRCAVNFARDIHSIPLPTAGARDAGDRMVTDLADHHAADPWSVNALIGEDFRAVMAALGLSDGLIYIP